MSDNIASTSSLTADEPSHGRGSRRPTISRARSLPPTEAEHMSQTDSELMPPPTMTFGSGLANEPHLRSSIQDAEAADAKASSAKVSEDDIKRWSTIAGITIAPPTVAGPKQPQAAAQKETAKPFPKLAPPPSSGKASGSRFSFFSRNTSAANVLDDDDSESDDGLTPGYAKLSVPMSDDEDDGYESDKPFSRRPPSAVRAASDQPERAATPEAVPLPPPTVAPSDPNGSDVDLRSVLREVLERLQALAQSHKELSASHTSLLTSLKISRSNLVMAEANTEMLEEELRRAKAAAARANPRNDFAAARTSFEQSHARTPSGSLMTGKEAKGWFGMKKPHPSPSPSEAGDAPPSPAHDDEVKRLRSQLDTQAVELETLKKGKKAIEQELEGLSQALFEEANKMVADERKRRAEVEESLKEVRGEREALRETIKVLGGRPEHPVEEVEEETASESPPEAAAGGVWGGTVPDHISREQTPNLDRHYAALRKSIHHVVDGPTPDPSIPGTPEGGAATPRDVESAPEAPVADMPGAFGAPAFDSEPNPWASNAEPSVAV